MNATDVASPRPSRLSGVIDCPCDLTFEALARAAEADGWSLDGVQPEPRAATVGHLLERRAPRPPHWGGGLLRSRCVAIQALMGGEQEYVSIAAPRKSSGPDLAYLFIGGQGRVGRIERAALALVRPAPGYLLASASFGRRAELFRAAGDIALIDPLATRHVSLKDLELVAYVPNRTDSPDVLVALLEDLGVEVETEDTVPLEARFRQEPAGSPAWRVSAPYATLDALCGALDEAALEGARIDLTHSDSHGAAVVVTGDGVNRELVEKEIGKLLITNHFNDLETLERQAAEAAESPFQLNNWRRPT